MLLQTPGICDWTDHFVPSNDAYHRLWSLLLLALPRGVELASEHGERGADAARNPGNLRLGRPRRTLEACEEEPLIGMFTFPRGKHGAAENRKARGPRCCCRR